MAELDTSTESSFNFAQEVTKQLITLATGIVALTITFIKDVAADAPESAYWRIEVAWILYIVSIVFGILTLMSLTSSLTDTDPDVYETGTRIVSGLQILIFLAALGFTIAFGFKAL